MLISLILSLLLQQTGVPAGKGTIDGVLRDDSGKPAAGVRVAAAASASGAGAPANATTATTDQNGHYRMTGVPAGKYTISAGRATFPTYYPGTFDVAGNKVVTVASGATVPNINFALLPISEGLVQTIVVSSQVPTNTGAFQIGTFGPGGVLKLFVSIQVEGGGKIPIFANGHFPKLKLTNAATKKSYEMWFSDIVIGVPRNYTNKPDEYKVAVEDLPEGYAVKSVTYRADEPGVRLEDVLHGTAKVSARASDTAYAGDPGAVGAPDLPIAITLTHAAAPPTTSGVRVTGTSEGIVVERKIPIVGTNLPANATNLTDAGIYLSGKPGILYSDGTFEFAGVSPGLHPILLHGITSASSKFAAAEVNVRDRNVEGVALQAVQLLPKDFFSQQASTAGTTNTTVQALTSINGHILDAATQKPVDLGTITLTGIGGSTRTSFAGVTGEPFHIRNLLPGLYTLTAEAKDYKSMTRQITVGGGDPSIDIKITRIPK